MKIEEARQKLCPMFRREYTNQNFGYGNVQSPTFTQFTRYDNCHTSACMMWIETEEGEGYCVITHQAKPKVDVYDPYDWQKWEDEE